MLSTIPNPTQDYLSESEQLHLEQNPGCVFQVLLVDEIFRGEKLIRIFTKDDSFAAVCAAVNAARKEMGLDGKWKIYESIQIENPF